MFQFSGYPYHILFYSYMVDRVLLCRVSPFGYLRIYAYLQLPAAFRSLSRPSSAPDAKAFSMCSYSLDLSSKLTSLLGCFNNLRLYQRLLLFPKSALRWRFSGALFLILPDFAGLKKQVSHSIKRSLVLLSD